MNRQWRIAIAAVLILAAWTVQAQADGFIHIMPGPSGPPAVPLAVNYHKVEVRIDNQVARTQVDEEFYNPNGRDLEGMYMFPVPKGGGIDKFTMFIDGKETPAELIDAAKARTIYEGIVRRMKDPALLEYADRDLFKVRVYPIPAHGTKRVKLSYNEVLQTDSGLCRYVYPLNTEKFSSSPLRTVSLRLELTSKFPIKNIYCPTHKVEITRDSDRRVVIGYEASNVKPDRDLEIVYGVDDKDVGVNLLTYKPAGEEGYFLCLLSPRFQIEADKIAAKDVCFVLDTSGSMADNDKIGQAKKALEFCLRNLGENDRFNIVRFSTETEKLFDKLEPYRQHIDGTAAFIRKLTPTGGTNIHDALIEALKVKTDAKRPYLVVFITDGLPTVGETDVSRIADDVTAANTAGTRIFSFGVGYDVNTRLLDALADTTRAVSRYVRPSEDMEIKISDFFAKVKEPVLSEVTMTVSNVKVKDLHPRQLPDLFRGAQLTVVGRFEGSGPAAVRIEGLMNGARKAFTCEAVFAEQSEKYDFVPRLWATQKVAWLLEEIRRHGSNKELVDQATQLAKKYGIVTPYTSYLIMEDDRKVIMNSGAGGNAPLMMDRDSYARHPRTLGAAGGMYRRLAESSTGRGAVDASKSLGEMKEAPMPMAPPPAIMHFDTERGSMDLSARVQYVGGKTFFHNGSTWVDTEANARPKQKKVTVPYLGDAYFKLLKDHPAIGKFLAVGDKLLLSFQGVTYEIR